uniref:Nucleolar and spindle-associated protein 1 n=1 Tax=Arion vulgaris TaxID=1028688 RepID=A0A0B7BPN8_9EUPU
MFVKDLESLKYGELQKLAKGAGIKANQKIDKLMKALKEHYLETENCQPKCHNDVSTSNEGKGSVAGVTNSAFAIKKDTTQITTHGTARKNIKAPSTTLSAKMANFQSPSVETVKSSGNKCTRKRRRTFELDEPTLSAQNTPTLDDHSEKRITRQRSSETKVEVVVGQEKPAKKRVRRDTYNKDDSSQESSDEQVPARPSSSSPGTRAMIDEIDTALPSAERKEKLLSALEKKIKNKASSNTPVQNSTNQPSQIPRFMAFLAKKKEDQKPPTPGNKNWTKIHNKEFSKFDSLDIYLEKKQQRIGKLTGSAKQPAAAVQSKRRMAKIVKPVSRPQVAAVRPFVPSVTSTTNITFNFSKTPVAHTVKSPANKKLNDVLVTKDISQTPRAQVSMASSKKTVVPGSRATPYVFTGNQNLNNTTTASSKKTFDLKASLAKPLSYRPHTGKLQLLDFNKTQSTLTAVPQPEKEKLERPSRQAMASKTRPINTKNVRRVEQLDRRNNQKYIDMMKRRGLLA